MPTFERGATRIPLGLAKDERFEGSSLRSVRVNASSSSASGAAVADLRHLTAIDGLRALAVLSVVVWHAIKAFQLRHFGVVTAPAIGGRGVDLFFVISGLCLSLPAFATNSKRIDYPKFMIRRITRIAPPYYAAIALFALLAFTPFGIPGNPRMAAGTLPFAREVARELAFFTSGSSSLNLSFWTLGVELRWYLLFPLLFALYRRSRWAFSALLLGLYCAYQSPLSIADMGTLPAFMLGIVAADLATSHTRYMHFAWPFVLPTTLAAILLDRAPTDHGNPLWHLTAFVIVLAGISTWRSFFTFRPLVTIGLASYSIYLIQEPVLYVAYRGMPVAFAATLSVLAGLAFWRIVEAPLLTRRRGLERAILRPFAISSP